MADITSLRIEINASGATATLDGVRRRIDGLSVSVNRAEAGLSRLGNGFNSTFGALGRSAGVLGGAAGAATAAVAGLSTAGVGAAAAMGGLAALLLRVAPLAAAAGGALATIGASQGLRGLVQTNAEYQRLAASLETVTGSSQQASAAFAALQDFARTTPFQLTEVTQAFIRMRALGLETSTEALRAFGNAASAFGTPLTQFVEAVADASVGEFERLREFGVRAQRMGDEVAFTFRGQTTMIRNDSLEIQRFLRELAETNFGGAMERQTRTIGGALSNLGDTFEQLQSQVGEAGFNRGFTNFIQSLERSLGGLDGFAQQAGERLGRFFDNLATQVDGLGTTLDGLAVPFDLLTTVISGFVNGTGSLLSAWGTEISALFGEIFRRRIVLQVSEGMLAAGEVIFTITRDWPRIVGTALQSLLALFTEFGRSVGEALRGNLTTAFDGFFQRIDRGFTEQVDRTRQRVQEIMQQGAGDVTAAGRDQGGGRLQRLVDESRRRLEESRQEAARAREEAERNRRERDAAVRGRGQGQGRDARLDSPPRPADAIRDAGFTLESLQQRLDGLTQQYAPAIQRQNEYNQAMRALNLALELPEERLRQFGVTQQQIRQIMEGVNRTLGEQGSLFGRLARDLDTEFLTVFSRGGNPFGPGARGGFNVDTRISERVSSFIQQAQAANEPLSDDQIQDLRRRLSQIEDNRAIQEARNESQRSLDQFEDQGRLFGVFGRARELSEQRQQFFRRQQELAPDDQVLQSNMDAFDDALRRTEQLREAQNTVVNGFRQATIEYAETVKNVASETSTVITNIIGSLEENLADFIQTGRFNFRNFLNDLSRELARFAARRAIAASLDLFALGGTGGFGGLGALFGGGRANGGPVSGSRAYLVGESGPEIYVPRQQGFITPMADIATRPSNDNRREAAMTMNVNLSGDGQNYDEAMIRRVMTDTMYAFQNERRFGGILR